MPTREPNWRSVAHGQTTTCPVAKNLRRSERILLNLAICVSGKAEKNQDFSKEGLTLGVGRYGARIAVDLELRTGQNIVIQRVGIDERAEAQVVGKIEDRPQGRVYGDRKSTRLNSSHLGISYAVFCLKKKY